MNTPPNVTFFVEIALLRLGKEMTEGLDCTSRTKRIGQIVNFWYRREAISSAVANLLLEFWQELLAERLAYDREYGLVRLEGGRSIIELQRQASLSYVRFCEQIGGCLDYLAVA